uniref:Uncharacterized protein n=1 Tax=Anguilla anguilla TaxID=7936 RepID=A0A0E9VB67_ANGAN
MLSACLFFHMVVLFGWYVFIGHFQGSAVVRPNVPVIYRVQVYSTRTCGRNRH